MATPYTQNGISIDLDKKGDDRYTKISYPLRYGRYRQIETTDAVYQFTLNGEIKFAKGKTRDWPNPQEWLKRTAGNDWIYYSTGGYTGVFDAIGEFYLPNLQYPTNSLLGGKPFAGREVRQLINGWHEQLTEVYRNIGHAPARVRDFLAMVIANSPAVLAEKARRLFQISGGRVTVLPPDARHVDYDVIPLTISTGCLYKCRFCKVKNSNPFHEVSKDEIDRQIGELKELFALNIANYNSIFLGEHDAFCCNSDLILYSAARAYELFGFTSSNIKGANVFMFGSVDSFLEAASRFFDDIRGMPCNFYINLGLESADQETLDRLGKPVSAVRVEEAFFRMQEINDRYANIEVSGNFLMDSTFPENHYGSFLRLVRDSQVRKKPKGSIYLSPLRFGLPSRELVFDFNRLKLQSRLPTYLYIIQRL